MAIRTSTSTPSTRLDAKEIIKELCYKAAMKGFIFLGDSFSPNAYLLFFDVDRLIYGVGVDEEGNDGLALDRSIPKNMNIWIRQEPFERSVEPKVLLCVNEMVAHVFLNPKCQSSSYLLDDGRSSGVLSLFYVVVVECVLLI